jgi:hypothetical protein
MEKEVFEKEIAMCQKCGVIPLLYKLGKGEFYETKEGVEKLKELVLKQSDRQ